MEKFGICSNCNFDFNKIEVEKGKSILVNCNCNKHSADITLHTNGYLELKTTAF